MTRHVDVRALRLECPLQRLGGGLEVRRGGDREGLLAHLRERRDGGEERQGEQGATKHATSTESTFRLQYAPS